MTVFITGNVCAHDYLLKAVELSRVLQRSKWPLFENRARERTFEMAVKTLGTLP